MTKAISTLVILFVFVITLPVWIGLAAGLFGAGIGITGAFFGIVAGFFGTLIGVIGSIFGAVAHFIGAIFGGGLHSMISLKPFTILLIILVVVLITRSRSKTVR